MFLKVPTLFRFRRGSMAKKVKRVKKVMNMQRRPSAKAAVRAAAQSSSESTTYYVHGPRGILAQKDPSQNWEWMMQDGLGSVRSVVNNSSGVEWSGSPDPFGNYFGEAGTRQTPYGFTGEYTDPITGMVHLRARDYHPALGVFPALDPLETFNRYSYVQGNPINRSDPSGMTDVVVDEPEVPAILVSGGNSGGMPAIWQVPVEGVRLENAERLVSNGYNMTPNFFAPPGTVLYTAPTSSMGRVNPIAQSALLQFDHVAQYQSNVMSGSVRLLIGYNENAIDVAKGFVQRIGDVGTFVQLSDTYLLYQDPYHMGQLTGSIRTSVPTPAPQTVTLPQLAQQVIPNMLLLPTILCGSPVQVQAAVATATRISPRDIALGFDRGLYYGALQDFVRELKSLTKNQAIYAYFEWISAGLSTFDPTTNLARAFPQAALKANQIHFNLEGISDPLNYAKTGNTSLEMASTYTAWELNEIKSNSEYCSKTIFYQNGTSAPFVDYAAKANICGQK